MQANKQDIAIKDLKRKTFKLIDFTFPIDINIFAKKFENISTYKFDVEWTWQLKIPIILTIVCALDLVKKGTAKPSRDAKGSILLVLLTF